MEYINPKRNKRRYGSINKRLENHFLDIHRIQEQYLLKFAHVQSSMGDWTRGPKIRETLQINHTLESQGGQSSQILGPLGVMLDRYLQESRISRGARKLTQISGYKK